MPTLNFQMNRLILATTRLQTTDKSGKRHVATGFFVRFLFSVDGEEWSVPTLVTNRHVARDKVAGTLLLRYADADVDGNPVLGPDGFVQPTGIFFDYALPKFDARWSHHPTLDLSATPLLDVARKFSQDGAPLYLMQIEEQCIAEASALASMAAVERVVMIGYPDGEWDEANGYPIYRRGITATHPHVNADGELQGILDIATFQGSSGSPILLADDALMQPSRGVPGDATLLGVLWGTLQPESSGTVRAVPFPTTSVGPSQSRIDAYAGYYVKAEALWELKQMIGPKLRRA